MNEPNTEVALQSVAIPNLPTGGEVRPGNTKRDTLSDLATALFEPGKRNAPPEKRDTTASTPSMPDAPESEASDVAPQQEGQPDTIQAAEPSLSPEERWRRDYQSEKDKRIALETQVFREKAEREVYEENQRMSQMGRVEQQATQQFQSFVQPMEAQARDLYNRAATAREEGDEQLAQYFGQTYYTLASSIQGHYDAFNGQANHYRQTVAQQRQQQQEKQLSRTLEKAGLTIEELKAHTPKLNTNDYFAVLEVATAVTKAKNSAEVKEAKDKAAQAEKDARTKWRTDSPASLPDKQVAGSSNKPKSKGGPGSGTADIAAGLGLSRKKAS